MKTIAFIGLGLIGGSIAKAIRKAHPDYHLLAYDMNKDILAEALASNTIDAVCEAQDECYQTCDYIFLCAPAAFNLEYLEYLKSVISDTCIITDTGSIKGIIHQRVEELELDRHFIGGHPLAGSERSGYENSSERLLENAYYIMTPGGDVTLDQLTDFSDLIESMNAIPVLFTSEEHDYITAGVNHLPHIIASALVNLINALDNDTQCMKTIAAGGFRDLTRIASSSPVMWQQICLENSRNISIMLDEFIRMLIQIRCTVDNMEGDNLYQMFVSSRDYRDSMDVISNGPISKAFALYLDITDEAGSIAAVATALATDNISIKNIGIIHNREFEQGVLKVEFYDEDAMNQGIKLLRKHDYTVYER